MKLRAKYLIVLSILSITFFNSTIGQAQTTAVDATLSKALATDELLPMLIDAAVKVSPEVKRLNSNMAVAEANLKVSRNALFNGLTFMSGYHYGTNYSAVNDESSINNSLNRLTTAQTGFYNVGVGLNIPVSTLLNRKHISRAGQAQIEMFNNQKDGAALSVRQQIIDLYQAFKLSHKILALSSSNKQAFQVNYNLAEKEFLQGQLSVSEISRMLDYINKAKMEYETNLNTFQTNLMRLEAVAGVSLMSLLKQVK